MPFTKKHKKQGDNILNLKFDYFLSCFSSTEFVSEAKLRVFTVSCDTTETSKNKKRDRERHADLKVCSKGGEGAQHQRLASKTALKQISEGGVPIWNVALVLCQLQESRCQREKHEKNVYRVHDTLELPETSIYFDSLLGAFRRLGVVEPFRPCVNASLSK